VTRWGANSALSLAADAGDTAAVGALLAAGAGVAADTGHAALRAAARGSAAVLRTLLRAAPESVHARGEKGCTPLHAAASGGHRDAVAVLLAAGGQAGAHAYTAAGARGGKTPADVAGEAGHGALAGELRRAACVEEGDDNKGRAR
jgi:ankyrin repeat protein